jgi:hypothetical protein
MAVSRGASRAAALALLMAFAELAASSCASVLGVNAYHDAVAELCSCDDLAEYHQCVDETTKRLNEDPEKAAAWIADYGGGKCICAECVDREPICTDIGGECSSSVPCCGHSRGEASCCIDPTRGNVCCESCATCSELFFPQGGMIRPVCVEVEQQLNDLLSCVCEACPICSFQTPCGGELDVTPECLQCAGLASLDGGQCAEERKKCL